MELVPRKVLMMFCSVCEKAAYALFRCSCGKYQICVNELPSYEKFKEAMDVPDIKVIAGAGCSLFCLKLKEAAFFADL